MWFQEALDSSSPYSDNMGCLANACSRLRGRSDQKLCVVGWVSSSYASDIISRTKSMEFFGAGFTFGLGGLNGLGLDGLGGAGRAGVGCAGLVGVGVAGATGDSSIPRASSSFFSRSESDMLFSDYCGSYFMF